MGRHTARRHGSGCGARIAGEFFHVAELVQSSGCLTIYEKCKFVHALGLRVAMQETMIEYNVLRRLLLDRAGAIAARVVGRWLEQRLAPPEQ